jgi:hypothetical protein
MMFLRDTNGLHARPAPSLEVCRRKNAVVFPFSASLKPL